MRRVEVVQKDRMNGENRAEIVAFCSGTVTTQQMRVVDLITHEVWAR